MANAGRKDARSGALGHVFGPVRSGRLGLSLGLDLLGGRICSFDCLYCEVGRTEARTMARKPYVRAETILDELAAFCRGKHSEFEVVTLGGLGEPTLNSEMGGILSGIRRLLPGVPTAVLTNSAHLADPEVRAELRLADLVLPSLDSLVPDEFSRLNQPHPGASLAEIREGLLAFRREFPGKLYLETLLCAGINDSDANLHALTAFCRELAPDRVDVVTVSRPGAWPEAAPASKEALDRFRRVLNVQPDPARITGHGPSALIVATESRPEADLDARILASLARRPQTAAQLAEALGLDPKEAADALKRLANAKKILSREELDDVFYSG